MTHVRSFYIYLLKKIKLLEEIFRLFQIFVIPLLVIGFPNLLLYTLLFTTPT